MKHKSMIIVLFSSLVLTGCIYVDDTDGDRHGPGSARIAQPTAGQELLDLNRAREAGLINNAEYQQAKEAILAGIH